MLKISKNEHPVVSYNVRLGLDKEGWLIKLLFNILFTSLNGIRIGGIDIDIQSYSWIWASKSVNLNEWHTLLNKTQNVDIKLNVGFHT